MNVEILDVLDVLAAILGILFTVRKLDARRRAPEQYPHVEPAAFEAWRAQESRIYSVGSWACFLKILLDAAFVLTLAPHLPGAAVRLIGAGIDLTWFALVVVTLVRGSAMRKERKRLGIALG